MSGVIIAAVGIGGWYPQGIARLTQSLHRFSPGYDFMSWINTYPPGAPGPVVEDSVDYGPYCAKPFALLEAKRAGADIGILVDASFYAVRPIDPLIDFIAQNGYYFCRNGFKVGEWASDACLSQMPVTREQSFEMNEVSSYCVGLNFHDPRCSALLCLWCQLAAATFPGPHTAWGHEGRNKGFVSHDSRVKGHRHDQTVLSILAHWAGMTNLVDRPRFTAYKAGYGGLFPDETTVFENEGMGS